MMRKIIFEKSGQITTNNEVINLKYRLLENEIEIDSAPVKCYGLEIKKTSSKDNHNLTEVKRIANVFFNKSEALTFLNNIASGLVTPIGLADVLEDYITDAIKSRNRLPILV